MEHFDRFIMGGPALLGWLRLHSIIQGTGYTRFNRFYKVRV